MKSRKSLVTLVAFCVVLATVAIVFVSRSHAAEQGSPPKAEPPQKSEPPQDAETGLKPNPKLVVVPVVVVEMPVVDADEFCTIGSDTAPPPAG